MAEPAQDRPWTTLGNSKPPSRHDLAAPPRTPTQDEIEKAARRVRALYAEYATGEYIRGPYLAPCLCGHGMHAHSGKKHEGTCTECAAADPPRRDKYRPDLVDRLVQDALDAEGRTFSDDLHRHSTREYANRPRTDRAPGEWRIGPSDVGGCGRAMWYRNLPPEGFEPDPEFRGPAMAGEVIEEAWRRIQEREYPWRQHQRSLAIKALYSRGRLDVYDPVNGVVYDCKSAGAWKWDLVGDGGALLADVKQVCLYADELDRLGEYVRKVVVVYINRDTFREEAFPIDWDDKARRLARAARAELVDRLTMLDLANEDGIEPERELPGPSNSPICDNCFARSHCWNLPRAAELGRSPESLTLLGEDPDTKEIEWTIKKIVAARKERTKADNGYKEVNGRIDGIKPGVYGEGRIRYGREGNTNYKALAEAYAARIEELGGDATDIPVPKNARSKASAELVRAAKRQETDFRPTPAPTVDTAPAADDYIDPAHVIEPDQAAPAAEVA